MLSPTKTGIKKLAAGVRSPESLRISSRMHATRNTESHTIDALETSINITQQGTGRVELILGPMFAGKPLAAGREIL
jgi:hypothetical protein